MIITIKGELMRFVNGVFLLIVICIFSSPAGAGSNWRQHGKVCNWNKACMKEQAKAQDLWTGQAWGGDLKAGCRKQFIQPYEKDYIGAVNCVYPLQIARQDYQARQAEIKRDLAESERARQEANYYRRGGSKVWTN
jgi:hypothetical protein